MKKSILTFFLLWPLCLQAKTIPYQTLESHRQNGKIVRYILVDERSTKEEVIGLAKSIQKQDGENLLALHIFDDAKAYHHKVASNNDGYSAQNFNLHYLAIIEPNGNLAWLAQGGKRGNENTKEVRAALPKGLIPFKIAKQWANGINVLVDEKEKKADVIKLAQFLYEPHKNDHFCQVRVFDNAEALASLDDIDSNYPENKFWKHNLVQIDNNNVDHGKLQWSGRGRNH